MKRIKAFLNRAVRSWQLSMFLALLLVFNYLQPVVNNGSGRLVVTFGTPEAYAAGLADYSLGTNGTSNAAQIQAALNALPSQGGLFHFKVGTYNITSNSSGVITRAIGNVTIEGEGRGTKFTGNSSFTAGGNQWVFRDLALNTTTQINMGATTGWEWSNVYDSVTLYDVRTPAGSIVNGTYTATQLTATTANISTLNAPTGDITNFTVNGSSPFGFYEASATLVASDAPLFQRVYGNLQHFIGIPITVCDGNNDQLDLVTLSKNNTRVLLSGGHFTFNGSFTESVINNYWLSGSGRGVTMISIPANANVNGINFGDSSTYNPNITVSDLTITGTVANSAGNGIQFNGIENPIVRNVEIRNFKNDGILFGGGARNTVYPQVADSYIVGNKDNGIELNSQAYGARIENNTIAGNGAGTANKAGVNIQGNSEHLIINNNFDSNAIGINGYVATAISIMGNHFVSQERECISMYVGSASTTEIIITGNTMTNNGLSANQSFYAIKGDFIRSVIAGNTISNTASLLLAGGIDEITPGGNNTIYNNTIRNTVNPITIGGSGSLIHGNFGYVTDNTGNITLSANTSIAIVNHGLATTPNWIQLTSTSNLTGWLYYTSPNATSFTVRSSYNVTNDVVVQWRATIGAGN